MEVRLSPRSSRTELLGISEGALRLKVKSPPVEGKANKECLRYLASIFSLSPTSLTIVKGKKGRRKQVLVPLPAQKVKRILCELLNRKD